MGIPDNLPCLLRNLYAGQEAKVRREHGTTDWFQVGTGVCQGCILSPCLSNLYSEYIMQNAMLDEAQAGLKIASRNINNLTIQMTPPWRQKVKKNWRASWWKWEWKRWLKTQHSKNPVLAHFSLFCNMNWQIIFQNIKFCVFFKKTTTENYSFNLSLLSDFNIISKGKLVTASCVFHTT